MVKVILAPTLILLKHPGCKKPVANNFQKSEMKIEMGDQGQCRVKTMKNKITIYASSYVNNKRPTK